jgi:glyoxylase-like metal-dependent hydrolase (beta-lactamase superfamily II)
MLRGIKAMFDSIRSLTLCLLVFATTATANTVDHFQVTTLAPDLLMLSTDQGSYSNNSLVFTGPDGLLLVDTHNSGDAEALRAFVEGLGFGKPKYIINTHRHVEHIGGNHLFGSAPLVVAHQLFPEKLRSGTFLFAEYPPEAFPDITFTGSMEITFNNEVIRLVDIGGSHDDNEIMVYFTKHGIAHVSSVVNGFNFPSVDGAGDVLNFEAMTRKLMALLPQDVKLVSGHHGQSRGYDFTGSWDQLPAYADMMKDTVEIVRKELAADHSLQDMQAAGVFDAYKQYAGSYVSTDDWIEYVVDALTVPRDTRTDVYKPIYQVWKQEGAEAAVKHYQYLSETQPDQYNFSHFVLMGIGSKLYAKGNYDDAVVFLLGSTELYPESKYGYYAHYLAASGLQKLSRTEEAIAQGRESVRLNGEFESAVNLLAELTAEPDKS